jgi:hypothetical protein
VESGSASRRDLVIISVSPVLAGGQDRTGAGMFTGIVQGMAEVVAIEEKQDFRRHVVRLPQA